MRNTSRAPGWLIFVQLCHWVSLKLWRTFLTSEAFNYIFCKIRGLNQIICRIPSSYKIEFLFYFTYFIAKGTFIMPGLGQSICWTELRSGLFYYINFELYFKKTVQISNVSGNLINIPKVLFVFLCLFPMCTISYIHGK